MTTPVAGKNHLLTWPRVVVTGIVLLLVLGAGRAMTLCYESTEKVAEALIKHEDRSDEQFMKVIRALHGHELALGHGDMSERVAGIEESIGELKTGQAVQQAQLLDIRQLLIKDRTP